MACIYQEFFVSLRAGAEHLIEPEMKSGLKIF